MEVVSGAEEEDGAGDVGEICVVSEGGIVEWAGVIIVADASTCGDGDFEALVSGGCEDGDFSAHGVAVDADFIWVYLWLLFEKGDGASGSDGGEEPEAVSGGVDLI